MFPATRSDLPGLDSSPFASLHTQSQCETPNSRVGVESQTVEPSLCGIWSAEFCPPIDETQCNRRGSQ